MPSLTQPVTFTNAKCAGHRSRKDPFWTIQPLCKTVCLQQLTNCCPSSCFIILINYKSQLIIKPILRSYHPFLRWILSSDELYSTWENWFIFFVGIYFHIDEYIGTRLSWAVKFLELDFAVTVYSTHEKFSIRLFVDIDDTWCQLRTLSIKEYKILSIEMIIQKGIFIRLPSLQLV